MDVIENATIIKVPPRAVLMNGAAALNIIKGNKNYF